jgi:Alpha/beta hydrolase domain
MRSTICVAAILALVAGVAEARVVKIEFTRAESPTFGGKDFGAVGKYEKLVGRAYGEVDPAKPENRVIQDIGLAPRNARGMVEYTTDVYVLKPVDMAKGNRVLFHNIVNRGNKGGLSLYNTGVVGGNEPTDAGDGFMMSAGYSLVWFGWQPDVLPGGDRITMQVPIARNPDATSINGIVRTEMITMAPSFTLPLGSGWLTGATHASYPTANTDNRAPLAGGFMPVMTARAHEQDARLPVPNAEWSFGACPDGKTVAPSATQVCMPAGFKPGMLYELTYMAKDPLVLGLGFAAMRDIAAFLKNEQRDDAGTANPLYQAGNKAILMGSSQSGRAARTFLMLGFNQDENGRVVYEGAYPHISGGLIPLNVRFGQPGRSGGEQVDHLFPGYSAPFTYGAVADPLSGKTAGILDRCTATNSCPRITHVATALELWELRQSLGFTDALGQVDLPEPANVRQYVMSSTQHSVPAALPAQPPFGNCVQQPNPNPQFWTNRALLVALTDWVMKDLPPPGSAIPTLRDGTLVGPKDVRFPRVPSTNYGGTPRPEMRLTAINNPLAVLDFGPEFDATRMTGIISNHPPKVDAREYRLLVAQVDADGNDLGGIRSAVVQAPLGTYTGWNYFRAGIFEGGFCHLQGSFVPFAKTRAEREAAGDPRLSIEERYPSNADYVAAVSRATEGLVRQRYLLPQDAERLVAEARASGIGVQAAR